MNRDVGGDYDREILSTTLCCIGERLFNCNFHYFDWQIELTAKCDSEETRDYGSVKQRQGQMGETN